jgi:hypothetical protein
VQTVSPQEVSDRLGTDSGTELRETAPNQCDQVQPVVHVNPFDQRFCDNASRSNPWEVALSPEVASSNPVADSFGEEARTRTVRAGGYRCATIVACP